MNCWQPCSIISRVRLPHQDHSMTSTLRNLFALGLSLASVLGLTGCAATKTYVLDSQSDVIRLSDNVRGDIFIWQGSGWVLVKDVRLPAGWYAGALPQ